MAVRRTAVLLLVVGFIVINNISNPIPMRNRHVGGSYFYRALDGLRNIFVSSPIGEDGWPTPLILTSLKQTVQMQASLLRAKNTSEAYDFFRTSILNTTRRLAEAIVENKKATKEMGRARLYLATADICRKENCPVVVLDLMRAALNDGIGLTATLKADIYNRMARAHEAAENFSLAARARIRVVEMLLMLHNYTDPNAVRHGPYEKESLIDELESCASDFNNACEFQEAIKVYEQINKLLLIDRELSEPSVGFSFERIGWIYTKLGATMLFDGDYQSAKGYFRKAYEACVMRLCASGCCDHEFDHPSEVKSDSWQMWITRAHELPDPDCKDLIPIQNKYIIQDRQRAREDPEDTMRIFRLLEFWFEQFENIPIQDTEGSHIALTRYLKNVAGGLYNYGFYNKSLKVVSKALGLINLDAEADKIRQGGREDLLMEGIECAVVGMNIWWDCGEFENVIQLANRALLMFDTLSEKGSETFVLNGLPCLADVWAKLGSAYVCQSNYQLGVSFLFKALELVTSRLIAERKRDGPNDLIIHLEDEKSRIFVVLIVALARACMVENERLSQLKKRHPPPEFYFDNLLDSLGRLIDDLEGKSSVLLKSNPQDPENLEDESEYIHAEVEWRKLLELVRDARRNIGRGAKLKEIVRTIDKKIEETGSAP
ncbi:hypothetical protein AAMO2058_001290600 [Amorphochlora amoebiformis]